MSGAFIGINNTLTTQAVMLVPPVERPVASSAYGFVRFIGGGLAPFVAGRLADAFNLGVPFYLGGIAFLLAIVVLATGHRLIEQAESESPLDATGLDPMSLEPVGATSVRDTAVPRSRPVVVAVGA